MSGHEEARVRLHGAGEGAPHVTEELALEEGIGDGPAVHGHEPAVPARARPWMARATSSLPVPLSPVISTLLGAGAHRAICSCTRRRESLAAHEPILARERRPAAGRPRGGRGPGMAPKQALHAEPEIVQHERLLQVVAGPLAQGLDGHLHRRVARHQDDRGSRVQHAGPLEDLEPADARHDDVGHDHVELLRFDPAQRLRAAPGRGDVVPLGLEKRSQSVLRRGLVVHHENRRCHRVTSLAGTLAPG